MKNTKQTNRKLIVTSKWLLQTKTSGKHTFSIIWFFFFFSLNLLAVRISLLFVYLMLGSYCTLLANEKTDSENRPVNILRNFPSVFEVTTQSPISIDVLILTRSDCSNDCYKATWLFRHLNGSVFHLRKMSDSKRYRYLFRLPAVLT